MLKFRCTRLQARRGDQRHVAPTAAPTTAPTSQTMFSSVPRFHGGSPARSPGTAFDATLDNRRGWHSPVSFTRTSRQERTSYWEYDRETDFPTPLDVVYDVQDVATISRSVAESPRRYRQRAAERPLPRYPETVTVSHGFPPVGLYNPKLPTTSSQTSASFGSSNSRSRSPIQCAGPDVQLFNGAPRPLTAGVAETGLCERDTRGWKEGKDTGWPLPTGGSRVPGPDGAVRVMRVLTGPTTSSSQRPRTRAAAQNPFDWMLDQPNGAARVLARASGMGETDRASTGRQLLREQRQAAVISDPPNVNDRAQPSAGFTSPHRARPFSVSVRFFSGKFLRFRQCSADTVWRLKERTCLKTGVEPSEQILTFDGCELKDDDFLSQFLRDGSVVTCAM